MKLGTLAGRAVVINSDRALDIAEASSGSFGPEPMDIYEKWDDFSAWAAKQDPSAGTTFDAADLGNPIPAPPQVFAVGLNYAAHAAESHYEIPDFPPVFTKFRASLAGPRGEVEICGSRMDWEVELVAVIGKYAHRVVEADGWDYIATLTVGNDISERDTQFWAHPPQFSLGKSYPGFAPMGPIAVTPDEFPNRDDIGLGCDVNGTPMQTGRTSQMIFSVPQLIEQLSKVTPLLPGDVIFTGTPAGVGVGRTPPVFLNEGDVLRSYIEGIGEIEQTFIASTAGK